MVHPAHLLQGASWKTARRVVAKAEYLALPRRIEERVAGECTTGEDGRPYGRHYWLLLAESGLEWRLFWAMVRRIPTLPVPLVRESRFVSKK